MEFPSLGTSCGVTECKILDFLPIICEYCKVDFCRDHFSTESHQCVDAPSHSKASSSALNYLCLAAGCIKKDAVEMACVKCDQHFCLSHRYHECFEMNNDQLEEKRQKSAHQKSFKETHLAVSSKIDSAIEKCKLSPKKQETAWKVQLIRLKNKAKGDHKIASPSRVYLLVYPPHVMQCAAKPVYVSKDWSIGRVIDAISSLCGVPNKNNVETADKLRLFLKKDGSPVETDMSKLLRNVLDSKLIRDGESIILEYVSCLDGGILKFFDNY